MIPADLLSALREKDPELFNTWIAVVRQIDNHAADGTDIDTPISMAWLQYCLQEAIRARGWRYGIDYDTDRVCATVLKNIDSAWKLIGVGYGSTEAEALMRAYLSALSGERI